MGRTQTVRYFVGMRFWDDVSLVTCVGLRNLKNGRLSP